MIELHLSVDGLPSSLSRLGADLERAAINQVLAHIKKQIRMIRDPKTGASPQVSIRESGGKVVATVSGSDALLALVKAKFPP